MEARSVWTDLAEYDRTREHLAEMKVPDIAEYLDIVTRPDVPMRSADLSLIRNREKKRMIADLIMELRTRTKTDLGTDPKKWVQRFGYQAPK